MYPNTQSAHRQPSEKGSESPKKLYTGEHLHRWIANGKHFPILLLLLMAWLILVSPIPTEAQNNPIVYRVELRLETAKVSNANTDDDIYVRLNNRNITWLDHPQNDFERGDVHLYDLMLTGISRLNDIQYFVIGKANAENPRKNATDAWCVDRIEVYINRGLLFRKAWPGSDCQWIDTGDGHRSSFSVSRREFNLSLPGNGPALNTLDTNNLQRIFQSSIGSSIATNSLYWSGDGRVRLSTPAGDTLHVYARLKDTDGFPDPTVQMDFDLVISCQSNGNVGVRIGTWRDRRRITIGGSGIIGGGGPPQLMRDARNYLQQILNRRAGMGHCTRQNMILVTAGPQIRIIR